MIARAVSLLTLLALVAAQEKIPEFPFTNDELVRLANNMRSADDNKAKPGQVVLDYQGHTSTRDDADNAKGKFFTKVDQSLLRKPTYEQFIALGDNFNRQTGQREPKVSAAEEKREIGQFITTIFETKPWKALYEFLHQKGHPFAKNPTTWRFWIAQLWFVHYSRARGLADTSGFEHVFMGEVKNGEISGMHNWLRFYQLERNATEQFDYKGFLVKRFNLMAALKFSWQKELKRSGSFLIGSSPEFDMALYTMCFIARRNRQTCDIEVDGCPLSITSYDLMQNGKVYIGTIYPAAGRITDTCRRFNG